jgi:UDP-N-acetyl-D-glucosamine dehydrogenase
VAENRLSLAIDGRENQLRDRLITFEMPGHGQADGNGNGHALVSADPVTTGSVAIVGLGYVGLPTAVELHGKSPRIIGIDVSAQRLLNISARGADLTEADQERLAAALADGSLELTTDPAASAAAETVIICVPTPVDSNQTPNLAALRAACAAVVQNAVPGQMIILTSTSYVGTTRDLLTEPLRQRGLAVGTDINVAFSPERIDPGNADHLQSETPRVVGGATEACTGRAAEVIGRLTDSVYLVSSPDAAEATKLYENIFRAVSLALANEFADACGTLGLDPIEVTLAAGTKPYGFLGVFPGPGVGGHCIPCDPHYLLWQLNARDHASPLIEQAMKSIELRPERVVERAAEVMTAAGRQVAGARVIVIGASYKAGVRDLRESPAVPIIEGLIREGAEVSYYDPLIPVLNLPGGRQLHSVAAPRGRPSTWPCPTRCIPDWTTPGRRAAHWSWTLPTSFMARPTASWCEDLRDDHRSSCGRLEYPRGGTQVRPEHAAPRQPGRNPQPGTAGRAGVRRARGALGPRREFPLPDRPLLLAAPSR